MGNIIRKKLYDVVSDVTDTGYNQYTHRYNITEVTIFLKNIDESQEPTIKNMLVLNSCAMMKKYNLVFCLCTRNKIVFVSSRPCEAFEFEQFFKESLDKLNKEKFSYAISCTTNNTDNSDRVFDILKTTQNRTLNENYFSPGDFSKYGEIIKEHSGTYLSESYELSNDKSIMVTIDNLL